MPEVCRNSADGHAGHASKTRNPYHRTNYKAALNSKVFVEGELAIVIGDETGCGDPAIGGSTKVFIGGIGVHRKGDFTAGHGSWRPNVAASGSSKVFAGG
jgi:uncharacterized Zn-binding protein involved in type VI secretion